MENAVPRTPSSAGIYEPQGAFLLLFVCNELVADMKERIAAASRQLGPEPKTRQLVRSTKKLPEGQSIYLHQKGAQSRKQLSEKQKPGKQSAEGPPEHYKPPKAISKPGEPGEGFGEQRSEDGGRIALSRRT